jgi:hypothetical protein
MSNDVAGVYVRTKDGRRWILNAQTRSTLYLKHFYRIWRLREESYGKSRVRVVYSDKARMSAEEIKKCKPY